MNENEKDFVPELIDQQIELPARSLDTAESRLVEDLQRTYHSYARANKESLWRVQGRLDAQLRRSQQEARIIPIEKKHKSHERKYAMKDQSTSHKAEWSQMSRALSSIAAVLVVTLLVGSLLLVLTSKKNAQTNTTTASGNTPVVWSSGIYMVTQKDVDTSSISKADAQTHKILWEYSVPDVNASSLTVYGNTVYYSAYDNKTQQKAVYALDADKGTVRWKANFGKNLVSYAGSYDLGYLTQPTYSNGMVYVIARTGKVTALDAFNGKVRWTYDSKASSLVDGTIYGAGQLVVSNGIVYGASHNTLFALHADNGKEAWNSVQVEQDQIFDGVQVVDNTLYAASFIESAHHGGMALDSYVYAFDAKHGTRNWRYPSAEWITSMPVIAGGNVYFVARQPFGEGGGVNHSTLYALNAKGKPVWHKDFSNDGLSGLVVGNGLLYFSDSTYDHNNGKLLSYNLYALYTENGTGAWNKQVAADPVLVQNGMLYTRAGQRQIVVYDAKSGIELWHAQYGVDLVDKFGNHNAMAPDFTIVP
jgi:outer membrane protein assembly factor BamB